MDRRSNSVGEAAAAAEADESSPFPLPLLALLATGVVGAALLAWRGARVAQTLGDTDDALRLVLVRDLASGRAGWWDQHFLRLQPPAGMDLHWSRLVDGGIVAVESGFRLLLDPAQAELAARTAWPLLWLFPVIAAAFSIARSLRGPAAVFLCMLLAIVDLPAYVQWIPGRIDHHNVQISLCLIALAGAVRGGRGGYAAAGAATGLGLAIGVEALIFEALIGAAVALRFLVDPTRQRGPARAYAVALLVTTLATFLVQTPPARWGVSVCDTLGANLAAGVAVASLGLLAASLLAERPFAHRAAALAAVGIAAGVTYIGLLPACLHGPLAQVDPRLWPVWLSHVTEMQPLISGWGAGNGFGKSEAIFHALAVVAWLWLGRRPEGRTFGWGLLGACLAAGIMVEAQAVRMSFYTSWFATPLLAAAVADFGAERIRKRRLLVTALMVTAVSPSWSASAFAANSTRPDPGPLAQDAVDRCSSPESFRALAGLPKGVVLAEVDIGSYVLAATPHAVLSAPYHRMAWGILSATSALSASPGEDQAWARRLHVTYVVDCTSDGSAWRKSLGPQTLLARLGRGDVPSWLEPLSRRGEPVQVYRVRP